MKQPFSSVVPIRPSGAAAPLFVIHGVGGVVPECGELIQKLKPEHPVYGIQSQAFDPGASALTTLEQMAAYHLREIHRLVPHDSYCFIGFSFGGMVAFEMAQQLRAQGKPAPFVGMIDSCEMSYLKRQAKFASPKKRAEAISRRLKIRLKEAFERPDTFSYMTQKIESRLLRMLYSLTSSFGTGIPKLLQNAYHINWFAAVNYQPKPYEGQVTLYKAQNHFWDSSIPPDLGWGPIVKGAFETFDIPGDHVSMFTEPNVSVLGNRLTQCIDALYSPHLVLTSSSCLANVYWE